MPAGIDKIGDHNRDFDLKGFLREIELEENHLLFLSIPDYHWALQDWGYTKKAERIALREVANSLSIVFDEFDKDEFDHIFLFSDHGFKFNAQLRAEEQFKFINKDRAAVFAVPGKGAKDLSYDDKLCSIEDIFHTVSGLFNKPSQNSLLSTSEREHIAIEDHLSIEAPQVNQNVDIWAIVQKDQIYAGEPRITRFWLAIMVMFHRALLNALIIFYVMKRNLQI